MITKHILSDGTERFAVRVMRYGKRRVLGRFSNPHAAIHVELESYRKYLQRVWINNHPKSTNAGPLSSARTGQPDS